MAYHYHFEPSTGEGPILLFLHGKGENAEALEVQVTKHGPWSKGIHIANQQVHDALSRFFRLGPHLQGKEDVWETSALKELLKRVRKDHASNIDTQHLFVAGVSRGGWGALELASTLDEKITAAAVFCPEKVDKLESAVSNVPIYLFHAKNDPLVKLDEPRRKEYNKHLEKPNFRFEEIKEDNKTLQTLLDGKSQYHPHACWTHLFGHPDLYSWFELMKNEPSLSSDQWPAFEVLPFRS